VHTIQEKSLQNQKRFQKGLIFLYFLLDAARKNGIEIIQSPFILDKNDKEKYKKIPFPPKLFGQFTANTWRADYTEGI